jgi:hypothetical protein
MKTFTCVCGQLIFFHNVTCVACHRELGFFPDRLSLGALEPEPSGSFTISGDTGGVLYRKCQNYLEHSVCNWMIPETETNEAFCLSCSLNEVIPNLAREENRGLWATAELAKRRLVYTILRLKLPLSSKTADPANGLAFRFLSDLQNPDGTVTKVLTGHDEGTITLNIAEADDALRERVRQKMKEPYRTLLGHFRHEIGHYYWDRLIRDGKYLEPYRALFGDERADYGAALQNYYANGPAADWQSNCVSAYSTAHPWEDWAETWAHFLHMHDTLEVADDFGLRGKPVRLTPFESAPEAQKPRKRDKFAKTIQGWIELTIALNSINRSMGLQDIYPFVFSPNAVNKLRFVSEVVAACGAQQAAAASQGKG